MGVVVTNIGSSSTVSAGTVTITIGAGGVPANTQIVVCACDNGIGGGASGSVADSKGNTYLSSTGFGGNTPFADIFRERTGIALVNGDTITYTLSSGATLAAVDAFYVQGLLAAAATANASAQGTSTTPSVTSGTIPTRCLVVGVVGGQTAVSSFTQDSTNAAWASPPGQISIVAPVLGGGNVVNTSTAALTYAPTLGTSDAWTALITAFRILPEWDFQETNQFDQPPRPVTKYSKAALRGKSSFAVFSPWQNMGWEVQSVQPPRRRWEASAATMRGDDGNQARFVNWKNGGWEVQPWQPPHRAPEVKSAAIARGDDGTQAQFVNWKNSGWEIQPFLLSPRYLPNAKSVPNSGDDGIQNPFIAPPIWWEIQSSQPPRPNSWRAAAVARGDDGNQANFINWNNAGWEIQPPPLPHPRPERASAWMHGDDGSQAQFVNWQNTGWDVQPPQPSHPRSEKSVSIAKGDDGIQNPFVAPSSIKWWSTQTPDVKRPGVYFGGLAGSSQFVSFSLTDWGWDVQPWQPPHPRPERSAAIFGGDDTRANFINWMNVGWEIQWQPPHPRPEKSGAIVRGDDGIENTVTPPSTKWWEIQTPQPPRPSSWRAAAVARGDDGTQANFVNWLNAGWEVQSPPPPHPRPEKSGALARGDDGTEFTFINWKNAGWEIQAWQSPHPRPEKSGAIALGEQGTEAPFVPPIIIKGGFDQVTQTLRTIKVTAIAALGGDSQYASFQLLPWWDDGVLQLRMLRQGGAALAKGDDGIENTLIVTPPSINWWEIQPTQPPHPRSEKFGALARGDDGTENTFIIWKNGGWEVQSWQPPRLRWERAAAIMRGDDGSQAQFINWQNYGWDIQSPQPPHLRPEKSGAIMRGDDGTENTFTFVAVPINWYETTPPSLPQPRQWRSGAWMRGDDGSQAQFINWINDGWEIQPPQPPHYAPEKKAAAWLRGDDGTQAQFINWKTFGWPVQPWQPPHPTPEKRAAAWMRGDDGNQAQFFNWKNAGWEIQAWQPPHAGVEEAGAIMFGDNGIVAPYIPPPPGVPLRLRTLMGFGL